VAQLTGYFGRYGLRRSGSAPDYRIAARPATAATDFFRPPQILTFQQVYAGLPFQFEDNARVRG
jgi:hypothetical protein